MPLKMSDIEQTYRAEHPFFERTIVTPKETKIEKLSDVEYEEKIRQDCEYLLEQEEERIKEEDINRRDNETLGRLENGNYTADDIQHVLTEFLRAKLNR